MNTRGVGSELDAALTLERNTDFADALMDVVSCRDERDYEGLPLAVRVAVAVNAFSLEVNSGGLYQVIANSSPQVVEDMKIGLDLIGATTARRVLDSICAEFPEARIPEAPHARFEMLDKLEASHANTFQELEHAYRECDEDVLALLRKFVFRQRTEIVEAIVRYRAASDLGR
jgi:hypothetical protein